MIFTPWCDQGLGIQSRLYNQILESHGIQTCIFAYKPYWVQGEDRHQKKSEEWTHSQVYYSSNDREHVTDTEIREFISTHGVTRCLIPETCWFRVFQVAELCLSLGVPCYGIPNIEIVRGQELNRHHTFTRIIANNHLCQRRFEEFNFETVTYIGFCLPFTPRVIPPLGNSVKFLFLGGHNAFTRKQLISVLKRFDLLPKSVTGYHLTVCIQHDLTEEHKRLLEPYRKNPRITWMCEHLSNDDIQKLYHQTHLNIQVSRSEGLGLGFYESIAQGIPVITLQAEPYTELIRHEVNGYVIPSHSGPLPDNDDAIIQGAYFDPRDLTVALQKLIIDLAYTQRLLVSSLEYCQKTFDFAKFEETFIQAIL